MAHETIKNRQTKVGRSGHRTKALATAAEEHTTMEVAATQDGLVSQNPFELASETDASRSTGILRPKPEGGWRATIGMFTDDAEMIAISEETLKIRKRRQAP